MPSNTQLDSGSGGDTIYTKQVTHDGDTSKLQGVSLVTVTGTEDSYTPTDINGSNPLPIDITTSTIDVMLGTDFSDVFGSSSVIGAGTEAGAVRVTIATDSTGVVSVDDNGSTISIDDGGGAITIDGTVTANLSATDNAVLDNIDTDLTTLAGAVSGSEMQVDIVSGNVTNAGTFAVQVDGDALTALQLIDDIIYTDDDDWTDGTSKHALVGGLYQSSEQTITDGDVGPLQVDSSGRLKVSIEADNAGIGGGTQYAEDAAHNSGDTGTMALGVRQDNLSALAGTSGDYSPLQVNAEGSLYATLSGVQSAISTNSSTTPLGGSATFTGTGEQNEYPDVMVSCFADQAGTLYFDFSVDGTNWRTFPTSGFAVTANIHEFHTALKGPRHFRVRFVNGSSAQGTFQLYTYFGNFSKIPNAPLNQDLSSDSDSITTKSVVTGINDSGNYMNAMVNNFGALNVEPEQHIIIGNMNATGTWSAVNDDATNLATTTKHVVGTNALTFDKANGTANTAYAFIEDTITSVDLGNVSAHDIIRTIVYLSDLTDVVNVIVRLGTDSSNYNEWQIGVDELTAGVFQTLVFSVGSADHDAIAGNGWNPTSVTYVSVGVEFGNQADTLTGIIFDRISFHTNLQTSAVLDQQITSTVSTSNINVQKVGNQSTNTGAGNVANGTQRVTIATDDANLAAINTAAAAIQSSVEVIDDAFLQDDIAFATGSSKVGAAGYLFDDSAPDTVDEDDIGIGRMSANRCQYVNIRDNAGNERGLNVDTNGDIGITNAALTNLDGAISGSEVQIDIITHIPGTSSNMLGKAVDNAAGGTDTGVAILAVRDDEQAVLTPVDGDYVQLRTDRFGNLKTTQLPDATSAVQYAVIDDASSGDNTLVAAAGAGIKIRVLSLFMVAGGDVDARFESGAGGTALTGQMDLTANSGFTLPYNPAGWFETADNALLNLELSAAVSVDGCLTYVEV